MAQDDFLFFFSILRVRSFFFLVHRRPCPSSSWRRNSQLEAVKLVLRLESLISVCSERQMFLGHTRCSAHSLSVLQYYSSTFLLVGDLVQKKRKDSKAMESGEGKVVAAKGFIIIVGDGQEEGE